MAHKQPNHLEPRSCQVSDMNTSPEGRQCWLEWEPGIEKVRWS